MYLLQVKVKKPKRHNPFMHRVKVTSDLLDMIIDAFILFMPMFSFIKAPTVQDVLLAKCHLQCNEKS